MVKLGALALGLLTAVAQVSAQQTVKIMPFGASIVSKCWRANLQTKLRSEGITNFNFVGTQKSSCGGANIDQDHEGHPGSQATDFAAKGNLTVWLNAVETPDIILMLLGTNDVLLGKKPIGDILKAYDVLIGQMRTANPKMHILFSNLLPLDPARWPATGADGIVALNTAIRQWVPSRNKAESPVVFVDNFSGFDAVRDTVDGEHPNEEGNVKMANKFLTPAREAIKAVSAAKKIKMKHATGGFLSRRLALLVQ